VCGVRVVCGVICVCERECVKECVHQVQECVYGLETVNLNKFPLPPWLVTVVNLNKLDIPP
jgi:hypothetical protein